MNIFKDSVIVLEASDQYSPAIGTVLRIRQRMTVPTIPVESGYLGQTRVKTPCGRTVA